MLIVKCVVCGKSVLRKPSYIAKTEKITCSMKCKSKNIKTFEERFALYTSEPTETGCVLWTGAKDGDGYGIVGTATNKSAKVHRVVYAKRHGPIPKGMLVLHDPLLCNNPSCVNVKHLRLGTVAENNRDKIKAGTSNRGNHPHLKIKNDQVPLIRARYAIGKVTQLELATEYGVSRGLIGHIVRGVSRYYLT